MSEWPQLSEGGELEPVARALVEWFDRARIDVFWGVLAAGPDQFCATWDAEIEPDLTRFAKLAARHHVEMVFVDGRRCRLEALRAAPATPARAEALAVLAPHEGRFATIEFAWVHAQTVHRLVLRIGWAGRWERALAELAAGGGPAPGA